MFTAWRSSISCLKVCAVLASLFVGLFLAGGQIITAQTCTEVPECTLPKSAIQLQSPIMEKVAALKQSQQRWLQVILSRQRLIAWEGDTPVYAVIISTGKPGMSTPTGVFAIQTKHRVASMQGADYYVPDVPHTMYYDGNYAIHGTYWHHNFGTPVSHGCINVAVDHAQWFFNWASIGTPVVVQHE